MKLTMSEASITALYAAPTLAETIQRMTDSPAEDMELSVQKDFFSALRKLKKMEEHEYLALDLQDVLVTDEDELMEVEENANSK